MLEAIIQQAAERGMHHKAGRFIGLLAESIVNTRTGGFAGFRNRFEAAGLADLLQQWIGIKPADNVLQPDQFNAGLGSDECNRIARLLDVPVGAVNMAGAEALPKVIGLLTREQRTPVTLPPAFSALLHNAPVKQRKGLGWLFWLLLAGLLGLFILAVSNCQPQPKQVAAPLPTPAAPQPTPAPAEVPAPVEQAAVQEPVAHLPAELELQNTDGQVAISGRLGDEGEKQRLIDALQAHFGADKVSGDIQIDPQTLPAGWLDKLIAALPELGVNGLKIGFDGDKLNIDTSALPEDQRFDLSQKLRELFSGYSISGLWERATAALAGLKQGFGAQDLVNALNLMQVHFKSNSDRISADSQDILERAADAIQAAAPGTRIEVGGHSDSVGTDEANLTMSQKRADAVAARLTQLGVAADSLIAKGYGQSRPVADNSTEEGRAKNRRIEFTVLTQ